MFFHVAEQHAELLRFLWSQREKLANAPLMNVRDLLRFDLRLQANCEGVLLAEPEALPVMLRAWQGAEPGDAFGLATIALAAGRFSALAEVVRDMKQTAAAVSAIGFASSRHAVPAIRWLAAQADLALRIAAARALRALRLPDPTLSRLIGDETAEVRAPAIEAAGLLRARSAAAALATRTAADRDLPFRSLWARWLIAGEPPVLQALLSCPDIDIGLAEAAARLAPTGWLEDWLRQNRNDPHRRQLVIAIAAALGTPPLVGWLLELLQEPGQRAPAAAALYAITGAPMLGTPATTPDAAAERSDAIRDWLRANAARFDRNQRYLGGVEITRESMQALLRNGLQGLRAHAAFEAARFAPAEPVLNVRSPAYHQLVSLGAAGRPP